MNVLIASSRKSLLRKQHEVGIFYLEERPPADDGPFLKEEVVLLDEVAEWIGAAAMRISAEQELQETNRQPIVENITLPHSH